LFRLARWPFVIGASSLIRHSDFVIRHLRFDVFPLGFARFAVGRAGAVVGFLQRAMRFCHSIDSSFAFHVSSMIIPTQSVSEGENRRILANASRLVCRLLFRPRQAVRR
jgi:hypothetical protein